MEEIGVGNETVCISIGQYEKTATKNHERRS